MFNRFLDSAFGYARNDGCVAFGYAQGRLFSLRTGFAGVAILRLKQKEEVKHG
ncbi:MAG: hypothetical protein ABIL62_03485 [Planctomycetota bacterium]